MCLQGGEFLFFEPHATFRKAQKRQINVLKYNFGLSCGDLVLKLLNQFLSPVYFMKIKDKMSPTYT